MAADVVEGRIRQIATEYAALVSREFKSCEIYLFGSHANETFTDDSDIDIAVVGDEFLDNPVMDMFHLRNIIPFPNIVFTVYTYFVHTFVTVPDPVA